MDLKKSTAPVTTTTIDKNLVDAQTGNIYEAISIIAKRAAQINTDIKKELIEKLDDYRFKYGDPRIIRCDGARYFVSEEFMQWAKSLDIKVEVSSSFNQSSNGTAESNVKKAKKLFDQLISYSNHLGLFSEDIDFETKRLLGNFPQAYSHLALIETAINFSGGYTEEEEIMNIVS